MVEHHTGTGMRLREHSGSQNVHSSRAKRKDYTGYDVSGMKFTTTVTKDNCIEGQGFCVSTSEKP